MKDRRTTGVRRWCVGSACAVGVVAAGVLAVSPTLATAQPSGQSPSSVVLSLESNEPHVPVATITLIAELDPTAAYGSVTLYDGSTELASNDNYRQQWSYSTGNLSPGNHHFVVDFTPAAASGYAPSSATLDYLVDGAKPSPAASPTPSVKAPSSAAPISSPKPKDSQPIEVTIPSVKATSTSRAPTSPTPSASPSPSVSVKAKGTGRKGPLPFTGFDAAGLVGAAVALLVVGGTLLFAGRRRRRRPARHSI